MRYSTDGFWGGPKSRQDNTVVNGQHYENCSKAELAEEIERLRRVNAVILQRCGEIEDAVRGMRSALSLVDPTTE